MSEVQPARVRFAVFEVDLRSGELRKAGSRVSLQEQPFRILVRLVQRPGELVTHEELGAELWPADTFVDFEHGLNAAIKRLRDALGDSAETPRFIETLLRRGYRFIAPVQADSAKRLAASGDSGPAPYPAGSRKWVLASVAVTEEKNDTPRKISLRTASGLLGIPSVPLRAFLELERIPCAADAGL